MGAHSAQPPGGSGGSGFNDADDIGSVEHDDDMLSRLSPELRDRVALLLLFAPRNSNCAGCSRECLDADEPGASGVFVRPPDDVVTYTLCPSCAKRWRKDSAMQERIMREAYRTIFRAGPDDVRGSS